MTKQATADDISLLRSTQMMEACLAVPDILCTGDSEILALARAGIDALGEGYIEGTWTSSELDRAMFRVFTEESPCERRPSILQSILRKRRVLRYLTASSLVNMQRGARGLRVAHEHYDLGNDLFQAMLDRSMTYTCGVWDDTSTLDEAQERKLRMICRKLELKPGMTVLDIGCGWGNFAEFAAREYGVSVTGVTISKEQAQFAQRRCVGLPVRILLQDYQEVQSHFDRVVSIEMIEAVGKKNLETYFSHVHRALKPGGLFVLQAISAETISPYSRQRLDEFLMWILRYIFPNGYLPVLPELMRPARSSFILEHLENLGANYERTLLAWAKNFEREWPTLSRSYDHRFYRTWRFYLYSCAALFRARITQVYQIVYRKA